MVHPQPSMNQFAIQTTGHLMRIESSLKLLTSSSNTIKCQPVISTSLLSLGSFASTTQWCPTLQECKVYVQHYQLNSTRWCAMAELHAQIKWGLAWWRGTSTMDGNRLWCLVSGPSHSYPQHHIQPWLQGQVWLCTISRIQWWWSTSLSRYDVRWLGVEASCKCNLISSLAYTILI